MLKAGLSPLLQPLVPSNTSTPHAAVGLRVLNQLRNHQEYQSQWVRRIIDPTSPPLNMEYCESTLHDNICWDRGSMSLSIGSSHPCSLNESSIAIHACSLSQASCMSHPSRRRPVQNCVDFVGVHRLLQITPCPVILEKENPN